MNVRDLFRKRTDAPWVTPELREAIRNLEPGSAFQLTTIDGISVAIMGMDDFQHVLELAGLRSQLEK